MSPKATALHQLTQSNGHHAVQGHSRSPISVPIESQYSVACNTLTRQPESNTLSSTLVVESQCITRDYFAKETVQNVSAADV